MKLLKLPLNIRLGLAISAVAGLGILSVSCQSPQKTASNVTPEREIATAERNLAAYDESATLSADEQQAISLAFSGEVLTFTKKPAAAGAIFSNIEALAEKKEFAKNAAKKADEILQKAHIRNFTKENPGYLTGSIDRDKQRVRVTVWNIERGQELDSILNLSNFKGSSGSCNREAIYAAFPMKTEAGSTGSGDAAKTAKLKEKFADEVCALSESDIMFLNEVDIGVCRSGFRNVAEAYAKKLNMNYAYAQEFFELEPTKVGLSPDKDTFCNDPEKGRAFDKDRMKNITGNAILSRFPIETARNIQLPTGPVDEAGNPVDTDEKGKPVEKAAAYCWDWHANEVLNPTIVDHGVRFAGKRIFAEEVSRELRYGKRNALVADVTLPSGQKVTLVNAHFENKATPKCRNVQLKYLLNQLKDNPHPIVFGGDFNTSNNDGGSRKVSKTFLDLAVNNTVKSPSFWLNVGGVSAPTGVTQAAMLTKFFVKFATTNQNPTRKDVFWLRDNPEGHFFDTLKENGYLWKSPSEQEAAQFLNDPMYGGPWSLTNERHQKGLSGGFKPTCFFQKSYSSVGLGELKLDWLHLKQAPAATSCLLPKNARTFNELRDYLGKDQYPSDHLPITMMLEFGNCNYSFLTNP